MEDTKSLINIDAASNVAIKLLEMLEKAADWVATPKGSIKDFNEGLEIYKREIENDQMMSPIEKADNISNSRKILREYINQTKIICFTQKKLLPTADIKNLEPDLLSFFFEHVKNISREDVQQIWANLLAKRMNRPAASGGVLNPTANKW